MHTILSQKDVQSFELRNSDGSHETFYATEASLIRVFLEGSDLYMSISYDIGNSFSIPKIIIKDIKGNIGRIEILANDQTFVVALKEVIGDKQYKRAVTGLLGTDGGFTAKPCEKLEINGEITNIQLAFREDSSGKLISWDYTWWKSGQKVYLNCQPHL